MRIQVNDRLTYQASAREITDNGFLKVPARVARTGVQEYLASELSLTDRPSHQIVRVYRPAEEVFKQDSLDSYNGADVTIEHPSKMVDAQTFRDVSCGLVKGSGRKDGDFVVADMIVKCKDAISAIEGGKVQVSAGYMASYDETPGTTPEGENYDFVQRDIDINHVAIVSVARGGAQVRLFDSLNQKGKTMATITLDSGRQVDVSDPANATLVAEAFDSLKAALDASYKETESAKAKAAAAEEKADKAEAKADEKEEELDKEKAKTSDAAIKGLIEAIASTMDAAKKIAGESFTCDSRDILTIQREALKSVNDSIDWADKSDVYVQARFDAASEAPINHSHRQLAQDGANMATQQVVDAKPSAYETHKASQANAWKNSLKGA